MTVYNGQDSDRVIKGTILKQVDGRNSVGGEEVSKDKQYIVIGTAKAAQSFWGGQVQSILQKPSEPLINIEELNSKIPQKEWELGSDGKPRAPWALRCLSSRSGNRFRLHDDQFHIWNAPCS